MLILIQLEVRVSSPSRPCGQHTRFASCWAFGPHKWPLATLNMSELEELLFFNLVYLYQYINKIYQTVLTFPDFANSSWEEGERTNCNFMGLDWV